MHPFKKDIEMNANELADWLETQKVDGALSLGVIKSMDVITMLRKQQAEIEELKILFDKTMNNWAKDMERKK